MTSVSAGHTILTPTQPVRSWWPERGWNPGPPHQESRSLPTELPHPQLACTFNYYGNQKTNNFDEVWERGEREREKDREREEEILSEREILCCPLQNLQPSFRGTRLSQ